MNILKEIGAILTIAHRDFTKLIRDRPRLAFSLVFPLIFVFVLGGSLQSSLGDAAGYNLMTYVFTGVLAQTVFQSTASGVVSLIQDRKEDFSQELFVSPVSRYSIILGKILGETSVSMTQIIGVIVFGFVAGVDISAVQLLAIIPVAVLISMFAGSFGTIVMANLNTERVANQVVPFIMLPQLFLSGVFAPITGLEGPLLLLSRAMPMTYAVDFMRSVFYTGTDEYSKVVLMDPLISITVIFVLFLIFLTLGTFLFVRNERDR